MRVTIHFYFFQGALSLSFEGVLNASNARNAYMDFMDEYMDNRRKDGKPIPKYEYDKYNWRYIFGLPPDLLLDEESLEYVGPEVYNKKRRKDPHSRNGNRRKENQKKKKKNQKKRRKGFGNQRPGN